MFAGRVNIIKRELEFSGVERPFPGPFSGKRNGIGPKGLYYGTMTEILNKHYRVRVDKITELRLQPSKVVVRRDVQSNRVHPSGTDNHRQSENSKYFTRLYTTHVFIFHPKSHRTLSYRIIS